MILSLLRRNPPKSTIQALYGVIVAQARLPSFYLRYGVPDTVDGRFGGCINLKTKIWDIAPVALILPEAGGKFTYLDGNQIRFELDARGMSRDYMILGGSSGLHAKLAALTSRHRG